MRSIRSITCRASLDDSKAVDEARANAEEGDQSWQEWVDEYDRGSAVVLRLDLAVAFDDRDGIREITETNHGVWIQVSQHPPTVAGQVADVVAKDYNVLSARLREHGVDVTATDLADMYARVELGPDVLRALEEKTVTEIALLPKIEDSLAD